MTTYVIRRVLIAIPVMLGISIIIFSMTHLAPGDPARIMLGVYATSERVQQLREEMGLDRPLMMQYLDFLNGILRGDIGTSLRSGRPVVQEVMDRLPATLLLAGLGMSFAIIFGIAVGVIAGAYKDQWIDGVVMFLATLGVSIPSFWLGLMLIVIFSVYLRWLPVTGPVSLKSAIMPAFSLGILAATILARLTRANMVEVLSNDYIRTARSKGLTERIVLYKHALRNALLPVVTIVGLQAASLLGGTFIIEQVFAWPGIGTLAINAILARDFPTVQGVVMFVAAGYVLMNIVVDITYAWLDPRIRYN